MNRKLTRKNNEAMCVNLGIIQSFVISVDGKFP